MRRQNDCFGDKFGVLRQPLRLAAAAAAIDGRNRKINLNLFLLRFSIAAVLKYMLLLLLCYCFCYYAIILATKRILSSIAAFLLRRPGRNRRWSAAIRALLDGPLENHQRLLSCSQKWLATKNSDS